MTMVHGVMVAHLPLTRVVLVRVQVDHQIFNALLAKRQTRPA